MATINLDYYKGNDEYTDGSIEDLILDITSKNDDYKEVLSESDNWAILYHLTPERRNLLEWYDFDKNSRVLEIGAGCGALTGLLCEKAEKVIAVELSKKRAQIIENRTKQYDNLEIIVGNLNDIDFEEKFDYITLIGVLEYAGRYTDGKNPYFDFLNGIKKLLKPNGKLIIALENKFGLKYWAGANEDHTGRLFDGIENYPSNMGIKTFGKVELEKLIKSVGFSNLDFYYPMPDYKIPKLIFSDNYLPKVGMIHKNAPNYDMDRYNLLDEGLAFDNIILNEKFDFFANSYIVVCGNEEDKVQKDFAIYNRQYISKFQTETSIVYRKNEKYSMKTPLTKDANIHIENILNNYSLLSEKYKNNEKIKFVPVKKEKDGLKFDYAFGTCMRDIVVLALMNKDKDALKDLFIKHKNLVKNMAEIEIKDFKTDENLAKYFGNVEMKNVECSNILDIDLIFDNLFIDNNGKFTIIDYEWLIKSVIPINYVIYRNALNFNWKFSKMFGNFLSFREILSWLDISEQESSVYGDMENMFLSSVFGDGKNFISDKYMKNIKNFESKIEKKKKKLFSIKITKKKKLVCYKEYD